jgi:hypothetical protein
MRKLFKLLFGAAIPAPWDLWSWVVASLPVLSAGAAIVAGYMEGFPWMYSMVAAALMFAGVGQGLVSWSNWRQKMRIAHKLNFSFVRPRINAGTVTEEVQLGIQGMSDYEFPLECEVVRFVAVVGDRIPQPKFPLPSIFKIPPKGDFWFDDNPIKIDAPKGGALDGEVEFEIAYGKEGARRYKMSGKKRLNMSFNEDGKFEGLTWVDAI